MTLILNIMTSKPIVTMMSNVKLNQPRTMAVVPTPALTLPLPKSFAITLAATEAVCCQSTLTRTNMELTKIMASATCDTGRVGKGLTSRSEPSELLSSCHPGNVARRRRQTKAKIIAIILKTRAVRCWSSRKLQHGRKREHLHQIGEHNHILKLGGDPNEIKRVFFDAYFVG